MATIKSASGHFGGPFKPQCPVILAIQTINVALLFETVTMSVSFHPEAAAYVPQKQL